MSIKVSVEYETPKTDKFAALMAQYKEVEKLSAETVRYYKPLADVAEAAKMEAILQQLEPLRQQLKQLNAIDKFIDCVEVRCNGYYFELNLTGAKWISRAFTLDMLQSSRYVFTEHDCNILGNWDAWQVYEKLEAAMLRLLENEMDKKKREAEAQVKRLHNITGG